MNKKGFTLVELLAVIAILAILVLVAVPNVLSMFNKAKKDVFLTDAKNIYKEVSKKYISESMRGNNINTISNDNNKLDMDTSDLKYNVKLDSKGNIKSFEVSNDTYCISGNFNNLRELTIDKIKDGKCESVPEIVHSFEGDDWSTIVTNIKNDNISNYNVGDTKEIDLGDYGVHTIRIANTSTPNECSNSGFSQTACGFVLEFVDIITTHNMNPKGDYNGKTYNYGWNEGGWPGSSMRTFVNNDIYNALPSEIKSAIINTTVVSGHGSEDTKNFTSIDKLYLLSTAEVFEQGTSNTISYDTARDVTRQLDYYKNLGVTTNNKSDAIKKNGTVASWWWLRTPISTNNVAFFGVNSSGYWGGINAVNTNGLSPAFRLG